MLKQAMALVFPGQGSQKVGMAASFNAHPIYAEHLASADRILGLPLSRYLREGPQEELTRTAIAQPALLTVSTGIYRVLQAETSWPVVAVAGHSLGEYTALVAAGSLDFETALKLVHLRGQLMQAACDRRSGSMCAILKPQLTPIRNWLHEQAAELVIANDNSPQQIVLSGESEALQKLCECIKRKKWGRPVPLKVSGAFHSPLMLSAREALGAALDQVALQDAEIPVIMNASAQAVQAAHAIRELLREQLTAPVRWQDSVRTLNQYCGGQFVELGAKTLSSLIRQTLPEAEVHSLMESSDLSNLTSL